MKLFVSILLFSLLIVFSFSCSKTTDNLEKAEKLTEINPDSSRKIISQTDYRKLNDKQKALYILVLVDLYDKQNLNIIQDSLLKFAAGVFEDYKDNNRLAYTHFFIGRMYKYRLMYDKALTHYMKAQDLISEEKYLIRGRIVSDIGDVYSFQRNEPKALSKYKMAYLFFQKAKEVKLVLH